MPSAVGGIIQNSGLSESEVDARVVAVANESLNGWTTRTPSIIGDDEAWSYSLPDVTKRFGNIIVSTNTTGEHAIFAFRSQATEFCDLIVGSSAFEAATGSLSGTDGTDGKLTVSVDDSGNLYFENRIGGDRHFYVTINNR